MAAPYSITFDDRDLRRLVNIGQNLPPRATKMMALEMWRNLRIEAPVDQGRLAGSFQLEQMGPLSYRITSGVGYAVHVLTGTRPHIIRPRYKRALYWPGAAHPVAFVRHPGTAPNPYVERAWERMRSSADKFAREALNELT